MIKGKEKGKGRTKKKKGGKRENKSIRGRIIQNLGEKIYIRIYISPDQYVGGKNVILKGEGGRIYTPDQIMNVHPSLVRRCWGATLNWKLNSAEQIYSPKPVEA